MTELENGTRCQQCFYSSTGGGGDSIDSISEGNEALPCLLENKNSLHLCPSSPLESPAVAASDIPALAGNEFNKQNGHADSDVMTFLLQDVRKEHESFTSRLLFLPENSPDLLGVHEPPPLDPISLPREEDENFEAETVDNAEGDVNSWKPFDALGNENDNSFILLSPRTFCKRIEASAGTVSQDSGESSAQVTPTENEESPAATTSTKPIENLCTVSYQVPQEFHLEMSEDRDNSDDNSVEEVFESPGDATPASSIYHAADTESFMSAPCSLQISTSNSNESNISGIDSTSDQLHHELKKCQGMRMNLEFNEDFDGDFECDDSGPMETEVLWANDRFFREQNGHKHIIIPEHDHLPDSPAEEDNDLYMEFVRQKNQRERLDPVALERSLSRFLHDEQEDNDGGTDSVEQTSSFSFVSAAAEDNDSPADADSVFTSSSADDDDNDDNNSEGSTYDIEYMGRSDVFWPMMTKSERKMIGAPSQLTTSVQSEPFVVEDEAEISEADEVPQTTSPQSSSPPPASQGPDQQALKSDRQGEAPSNSPYFHWKLQDLGSATSDHHEHSSFSHHASGDEPEFRCVPEVRQYTWF